MINKHHDQQASSSTSIMIKTHHDQEAGETEAGRLLVHGPATP